jgi:hypothetical protein
MTLDQTQSRRTGKYADGQKRNDEGLTQPVADSGNDGGDGQNRGNLKEDVPVDDEIVQLFFPLATSSSLRTLRRILPTMVVGSSSLNSMREGIL